MNRLQGVHEYTGNSQTEWQQEYVYDRWGNRTIHQTNTWGPASGPLIPKPNFGVDPANNNRLAAPAGYTMSYDPAGNLTYDNYSGQGQRTFDAENRMTGAQGGGNGSWQYYTYNAAGQRVNRKVNGTETWQVYGIDGELVAEYPASGAVGSPQKEYGYRNGQLLITAEASSSQSSPQTYKASTDFSAVQGQSNWYYLDSNGTQLTYLNQWGGVWNLPNTSVYLGGSWGHPGDTSDAVRQWRAPGAGSIHITGTAYDSDPTCGDGVIVLIKKGTQVLWSSTIENGNTTGVSYDVTTTVVAGDQINFVINQRSNTYCDSTTFDPAISFPFFLSELLANVTRR